MDWCGVSEAESAQRCEVLAVKGKRGNGVDMSGEVGGSGRQIMRDGVSNGVCQWIVFFRDAFDTWISPFRC